MPFADQCGNGDNGAELQRELVLSGPYLTEENIVIELGKFGEQTPQVHLGLRSALP